ncbi:MAG: ATP-binding protein, partial [Planctomycetota bacterium]
LHVVRYEGLISSYLGETAQKIQSLFEFAKRRQCVLFFDEFDAIGKERGDKHETGEIKRVVNTLLMQIDQLPSHVVLIVATNHPELIDRAAWRRFQIRLSLPNPTQKALKDWINRFQAKQGQSLGVTPASLAKKLIGASFAEVEDFALDIRRRQILEMPDADLKKIVNERLASWKSRFQVTGNGKAKKQSNSVSKAKGSGSKTGSGRRK